MDLLNPAALWGLLVLGVLFLLPRIRLPRKRVEVANAFLWRSALSAERPKLTTRIKRHISIILQAAALTATVLALARPVWLTGSRSVVLVMDLSASMGARDGNGTRFDTARARALDRVAALPFASRVRLVTAAETVTYVGEFNAAGGGLRSTLERLAPAAGGAALHQAIAAARATSDDPIIVVSDTPHARTAGAEWIAIGKPVDNVAIAELSLRRLIASPLDVEVFVSVRNHGAATRTTLTIRENDREVARETLDLPADGGRRVIVQLARPQGAVTATIDADDGLRADNSRFAVLRSGTTQVELQTSGSFFLERALEANPSITLRRSSESAARTTGIVVCDGCSDLPAGRAAVLMIRTRSPNEGDPRPLRIADRRHPMTSGFQHMDVAVTSSAIGALPADAVVLARAGDAPALAVYEHEGRRVAVVAIDVRDPAFATQAAFPILLAQVIDWLAEGDAPPPPTVSGRPARWRVAAAAERAATGPDGRTLDVQDAGEFAVLADTAVPGVYRIGDERGRLFVVNPAAGAESDLRTLAPPPSGGSRMSAGVEQPLSLFAVLLAASVLLVTIEWRVYCRARAS